MSDLCDENQLISEPKSIVHAMLEDSPAGSILHIKSLKKAKKEGNINCYIWDNQRLYYIQEDGAVDPVRLKNPQQLTALFNHGLNTYSLSAEQIREVVTKNGGNVTLLTATVAEEKEGIFKRLLKRLPFYSGFFTRSIANNGNNISKLLIALGNVADLMKNVQLGFKTAGLIPAIIDFVELPFLLLAALILKEKLPLNFSNTARWLYAIGALALVIISIAAPSISTAITLAIAAYTLAVGVFNFMEMSYHFFQTQSLKRAISAQQYSLGRLREEVLELALNNDEIDETIIEKLNQSKAQYDKEKEELLRLKAKFLIAKKTTMSTSDFLTQLVTLGLRVVAVVGAALVFCTPVIGHSLLVASGLLITAILVAPMVLSAWKWLKSKIQGSTAPITYERLENNDSTEIFLKNLTGANSPSPEVNNINQEQPNYGSVLTVSSKDKLLPQASSPSSLNLC